MAIHSAAHTSLSIFCAGCGSAPHLHGKHWHQPHPHCESMGAGESMVSLAHTAPATGFVTKQQYQCLCAAAAATAGVAVAAGVVVFAAGAGRW